MASKANRQVFSKPSVDYFMNFHIFHLSPFFSANSRACLPSTSSDDQDTQLNYRDVNIQSSGQLIGASTSLPRHEWLHGTKTGQVYVKRMTCLLTLNSDIYFFLSLNKSITSVLSLFGESPKEQKKIGMCIFICKRNMSRFSLFRDR